MTENDKAQVRAFLASEAAKTWIEEGKSDFKEMDLESAKSKDLYDISLHEGKGWRNGIQNLIRMVQPSRIQDDFGTKAIDPVPD